MRRTLEPSADIFFRLLFRYALLLPSTDSTSDLEQDGVAGGWVGGRVDDGGSRQGEAHGAGAACTSPPTSAARWKKRLRRFGVATVAVSVFDVDEGVELAVLCVGGR